MFQQKTILTVSLRAVFSMKISMYIHEYIDEENICSKYLGLNYNIYHIIK